jgi:hypothetical protein
VDSPEFGLVVSGGGLRLGIKGNEIKAKLRPRIVQESTVFMVRIAEYVLLMGLTAGSCMEITCDGLVCRVDGGEFTRRRNDQQSRADSARKRPNFFRDSMPAFCKKTRRPRRILDENDNEK